MNFHAALVNGRPSRAGNRWGGALMLLLAAAAALAGCGKTDPAVAGATTAVSGATAATGAAGRYPLTGEVLRIDADKKVLTVRHDEIKGYMPAMTMEFAASAGDVAVAKVGQRIRAELVPATDGGDFRLEKIWPDDKVTSSTVAAGALQLRQDTHARGKHAYREVGETVPDFALYDQAGRVAQSSRFRGKQILLNFIFTRCPDATMCPAATIKMMAAQKLAREGGVKNVELVSITLDPEFDTPGVLREYADARGIDTSNYSFLTGPEKAIRDLLTQFGVLTELQGDLLRHTLTTLLIDENGKIIHRADGRGWEPADFVARMKRS